MTNMLISAMTSVYVRVVFNAKSLKESMIAMIYYVLLISAFSFFFSRFETMNIEKQISVASIITSDAQNLLRFCLKVRTKFTIGSWPSCQLHTHRQKLSENNIRELILSAILHMSVNFLFQFGIHPTILEVSDKSKKEKKNSKVIVF